MTHVCNVDLTLRRDEIISLSKTVVDTIDKIRKSIPSALTFQSVVGNVDKQLGELTPLIMSCTFASRVRPDVADVSLAAASKIDFAMMKLSTDQKLYACFDKYYTTIFVDEKSSLSHEQISAVEKIALNYKLAGCHCDTPTRQLLSEIRSELNECCREFEYNLDSFSCRQHDIKLDNVSVHKILSYCDDREYRKRTFVEFANRCDEANSKLLLRMIKLRAKEANILNYSHHQEYVLENAIASSSNSIAKFLDEIEAHIKPHGDRFYNLLKIHSDVDGVDLQQYDIKYYTTKVIKHTFGVDEIKFNVTDVINGMLNVYSKLLSLEFTKVTNEKLEYHPDVTVWQCEVGTFVLDLYQRDKKFMHYAEFCLQPGVKSGPRAIAAVLGSFGKTASIAEVITVFHEFGHVMHELCSKTTMYMFSGTATRSDFVEAPSQMLENWCQRHDVVKQLAPKLSHENIDIAIKRYKYDSAFTWMNRIANTRFDNYIHTLSLEHAEKLTTEDLAAKWHEFSSYYCNTKSNGHTAFAHMASGYSGRYYGYLFAKMIADDMYAAMQSLDNAGEKYKREILSVGGSIEPMVAFERFTGRPLNSCQIIKNITT